MKDWKEAIDQFLNNQEFFVEENETVRAEVKRFHVFRDENKDIVIDLVYDGWTRERRDCPPAGTLGNTHDEKIVFRHRFSGKAGEATGVLYRHSHSSSESGSRETTQRYTAHSINVDIDNSKAEAFCVEHIDNLSLSFLWPNIIDIEETNSSITVLRWEDGSLSIPSGTRRSGGSRAALQLNLGGYDLVICADDREDRKRAGKIVYVGNPAKITRDKIRDVISFVFGRPIVYYGYTLFSREWSPLRAVSIDAYSINGMMFRLHALHPYPLSRANARNFLDKHIVQTVCNCILGRYEQLDFQKSSWAYWHAMCAPYHMEAAHFGALVEKVQNVVAKEFLSKDERNLFTAEAWRKFRPTIIGMVASADIKEENRERLAQAVDGIGRVPQALIMKKLFQKLDIPLGEIETIAWNQRNEAAHGVMKDDHIAILLNNKVLRLIYHRLIAGITKCSSQYIDYYSLNFPVRDLREFLPARVSR